MATYMLVRHKIKDFTDWKNIYNKNLSKCNDVGLSGIFLLYNEKDHNEVIILSEASVMDKAKAFYESDVLRETIHHAGAIDKPDIYFLKK